MLYTSKLLLIIFSFLLCAAVGDDPQVSPNFFFLSDPPLYLFASWPQISLIVCWNAPNPGTHKSSALAQIKSPPHQSLNLCFFFFHPPFWIILYVRYSITSVLWPLIHKRPDSLVKKGQAEEKQVITLLNMVLAACEGIEVSGFSLIGWTDIVPVAR